MEIHVSVGDISNWANLQERGSHSTLKLSKMNLQRWIVWLDMIFCRRG